MTAVVHNGSNIASVDAEIAASVLAIEAEAAALAERPPVAPVAGPSDARRLLLDVAVMLHDDLCTDDGCEGWGRVSSFGKRGWTEAAQRVIAKVQGKPDPEWSAAPLEPGIVYGDPDCEHEWSGPLDKSPTCLKCSMALRATPPDPEPEAPVVVCDWCMRPQAEHDPDLGGNLTRCRNGAHTHWADR